MPQVQPIKIVATDDPKAPSWLTSVPLVVAYLIMPLYTAPALWPKPLMSPFLPWLVLAGLGTIWATLFRRSGIPVKKRYISEVFAFLILVALLFSGQDIFLRLIEQALPLVKELAPAGILGFCLLWSITFGVPGRAAFQRYGGILAILCIAGLAVGAVLHRVAPPQPWSGDSDMLAGLLLVSLCASLRPGDIDGGVLEPDQGNHLCRGLILLGLAACLSRTGLFAAGWIYLFFGRGSKPRRMLIALAFFLLLGLTVLLPLAPVDDTHYINYWLWAKSIPLLLHEPGLLLTGLPFDLALPFAVPQELAPIWERITGSSELLGVQLAQIGPFWLRVVLGWGILVPLGGLTALIVLLNRRVTRMGAGLTAALVAQGMVSPLFHDPALGAAFGLALILTLSRPTHHTFGTDAESLESNPPRNLNMRPL